MSIDTTSVYTFEFFYDVKNKPNRRVRRVPIAELWKKFSLAAEWARGGRPSEHRSVTYYGPGISKCVCNEYTRDRLREILEPLGLVPLEPAYVGLLWAWLDGGYGLYKIRQETVEMDGFERPHAIQYGLDRVDDDKVEAAFWWSQEKCWFHRGVWIDGRPGLLFMGNHVAAYKAIEEIPQVSKHFIGGRLPQARVRYDFTNRHPRYPYMLPTRPRPRIQDLRGRYPFATEDLAVVPSEVLRRDYELGIETGISPTPAFAG